MNSSDPSFAFDPALNDAVAYLTAVPAEASPLPDEFPTQGMGENAAMALLAPHVLGGAAKLGAPDVFAHMDPPTPWITWAAALWNASVNQNLLHPATSPFATDAEGKVIKWLSPYFGMRGGHMCSGSTLANLTAIWAARDSLGIQRVVSSDAAHISIPKAAKILGLDYHEIGTNERGQMDTEGLGDLSDACLVLTAGTTNTGAIDPMHLAGQARWTHVDAAWAGPLRLSKHYGSRLNGIENADSVAISAHKWLFQPKDAAMVLFKNPQQSQEAISFGGSYLTKSNVGVQGSRGANGVPLLATLLSWGKAGLVSRIEHTLSLAEQFACELESIQRVDVWARPSTGVTLFRPTDINALDLYNRLPAGMFSTCRVKGEDWIRSVAANPMADIGSIIKTIRSAL